MKKIILFLLIMNISLPLMAEVKEVPKYIACHEMELTYDQQFRFEHVQVRLHDKGIMLLDDKASNLIEKNMEENFMSAKTCSDVNGIYTFFSEKLEQIERSYDILVQE